MTTSQPNGQAPCDVQWGGVEDAWLAGYVTGATDLLAEVDRLRHGEKVRDGMLDMFRSGYELDRHRGAWVRVIVSYGDAEQEGHRLTPDEVAVLAALDTEEDA
jgi:hypothetical protein